MKDARDIQMSMVNNTARLNRIDALEVSLRFTSLEDRIRPYFQFSDELAMNSETIQAFCSRLRVTLTRSGEDGIPIRTIETEMKKFLQTMLLHCTMFFGDESDTDTQCDMFVFPDDEGYLAATN